MPTHATTSDPTQNPDLQKMLSTIEDLPSIPETLMAILKVLDDPHSGATDLAEVVRLDAPLMSKILKLANSPYYSRRGDLTDINRCIAVLGYRTVRQVAICITVATTVVSAVSRSQGHMDYRELWRHSVVTGAVAKHLAAMVDYRDPEEVFSAGLLHDMGKFILEIHAPRKYAQVIAHRQDTGRSLCLEEEEAFGFNHAQIGAAFGQSWRFPEILIGAFGQHHEPVLGTPTNPREQVVALVALADYLANTLSPPRSDLGFDPRLIDVQSLHRNAGLDVRTVEDNLAQIREAVQLASAYLDLR
ncbi:hypothetical protein CSB20_09205 [bacterium DOLZORAL124_64_63]|nr:MAG: hypothetical protein CSB20_09205 [bacterium DOLZORAL124_64_63]